MTGLKKFAHITSLDVLAAMYVEEVASCVSGFEMRIFEDVEDAKSLDIILK